MKKITFKTTALLLTVFITSASFISCASSKTSQTQADVYETEEDLEAIPLESKAPKNDKKKTSQTNKNSSGNRAKDFFQDLVTFTNKDKFLRYDATSLFTPELTGIKERSAQVLIRMEDQWVGWGSPYQAAYYMVVFDEEARDKLRKAADAYFSDFENKRLQRKGKHTDRAYGKITYGLAWGATSATTPNNGIGEGYLGYEFVKNSPYFVIYNYPFENKYYERAGDATTRESMTLRYYFTRSQLRLFLDLISEEKIAEQLAGSNYFIPATEADEYEE